MISHTEHLNVDQVFSRRDEWPILESARIANDGTGINFDPYSLSKLLKNRKHAALVHISGRWIRVRDLKNFLTIFKNDGLMKMTPHSAGLRILANWDKVNVNFLCQKKVGLESKDGSRKNRWLAGCFAGLFAVSVPTIPSKRQPDAAKVTPETPTQPDPVVETVPPVTTTETPTRTPTTPKTRPQRFPTATKCKIYSSNFVAQIAIRGNAAR